VSAKIEAAVVVAEETGSADPVVGPPPVAADAAGPAPAAEGENASGALLNSSAAPSRIRAVGVLVKWSVILMVFLGICYAAMRFVFPFLQEYHHPTKGGTVVDKEAPTAVKMLQQTRAVIDQNNKNVSHVNDIAAAALNEKPKPPPAPVAQSAPVIRPKPPGVAVTPAYLEPFQAAISRLKISGVAMEPEERAYVNGRVVKFGDIVDRDLAIRFMGVDPEDKVLLFTNADNVVFKMHY
jgi:hypothetical protein